jgi:RNA polymerase sigma-70 factor (ECF subfamily)
MVALARRGDPAAFAWLFERYRARIFNYLYRLFGDADDAGEFAQDAFLKAYRALPATSADLRVGPWLYRIATNVALDAFRHRALVRWESLDRALGASPAAGARHPWRWDAAGPAEDWPRARRHGHTPVDQDRRQDPQRAALDADEAARVRAVLWGLPTRYRVCLTLREFHDLSYDEIAARLGTTRAAVKSILFRARQTFRGHWLAQAGRPPAEPVEAPGGRGRPPAAPGR